MAKIRNKTGGDKGAYLNGLLVMVPAGQTAEADDYPAEWFEIVGDEPEGDDDDGEISIPDAIAALDPDDDEHWTEAGMPAVDAVSEIVGERVSRSQIDAAAPNAKRP